MTNVKKIFSSLSILGVIAFSAPTLVPAQANAVLLVELASNQHVHVGVVEVVLCIVLLPICLLDEKAAPTQSYSSQDLLDNGYNTTDVARIEADQSQVMTTLHQRGLALQIESSDTPASVAAAVRSLDPSVSDTYLQFVADMNHVNTPAN